MTKTKKNTKTNKKPYGVKYKFFKKGNAIMLIVAFGEDMQKQLKIKKGTKLVLVYDLKNPYKITIKKAPSKKEATNTVVKNTTAKNVHITPTWKFKKPLARLFKQERKNANLKIRKNDFVIELI